MPIGATGRYDPVVTVDANLFASVDTTMATRRMVGRSERGRSKRMGGEKSQWSATCLAGIQGDGPPDTIVDFLSPLRAISSSPPDIPTSAVDQR